MELPGCRINIFVEDTVIRPILDSLRDYGDIYERYWYYFYKFENIGVRPGQLWIFEVSKEGYDSLHAECTVPDSVKNINYHFVFNKEDSVIKIEWDEANYTKGYLPRIYLVTDKDSVTRKILIGGYIRFYEDGGLELGKYLPQTGNSLTD